MFEKEAEEWRNSLNYEIDNDTFNNIVIPCIEFGYNKGFEFGVKSNEKVNQIVDNEWHYVKDELPPEDVPLLCMRGGNVYVAWFILGKWKGDKYNDVKKPYAWREVKLPEPGLQMPMQEG